MLKNDVEPIGYMRSSEIECSLRDAASSRVMGQTQTRRRKTGEAQMYKDETNGRKNGSVPNHRPLARRSAQQIQAVAEVKKNSRCTRCECRSHQSSLAPIWAPLCSAVVILGPALLVSNKLQVVALLILNTALRSVLNFMNPNLSVPSPYGGQRADLSSAMKILTNRKKLD